MKILLLGGVLSIAGVLSDLVLSAQNAGSPLKFDYYLYGIDKSLGVSAFMVARLFTEWQRDLLYLIYQVLPLAMVFWYAVNLKSKSGKPLSVLIAYGVNFLAGPALYLLLPACGPRYAFGAAFPTANPEVPLVLTRISGWPNAIPSLHLSTALLFLLFAGKNPLLRVIAWAYLAGTVCATLAFEHYVIDLIVGVPFACFAANAAIGNAKGAVAYFALVIAWILSIRAGAHTIVLHPAALRLFAASTVLSAVTMYWQNADGLLALFVNAKWKWVSEPVNQGSGVKHQQKTDFDGCLRLASKPKC